MVVLVRCVTAPACCRVQIPTTLVDGRAPLRSRALRAKSLGSNRAVDFGELSLKKVGLRCIKMGKCFGELSLKSCTLTFLSYVWSGFYLYTSKLCLSRKCLGDAEVYVCRRGSECLIELRGWRLGPSRVCTKCETTKEILAVNSLKI